MYLEDSNGNRHENPSTTQITAMLEQIGTTVDHCILELDGDDFVQAAGAPGRLFVQYGSGGTLQESARNDLDVATVARVFADAMAGNDSWKAELGFTAAGAGGTSAQAPRGPASAAAAGGQATGAAAGSSLKDEILGSVKRQAGREVSYGVGRMVRRLLRRLLGGRF